MATTKTHDCLSQVRKDIMATDSTINHVYFDLSSIVEFKSGKINPKTKTGQRIEVGFKSINKKGQIVFKTKKTFITHEYCPFCGKKY